MTLVDFKRLSDAPPPIRELLAVDDDGGATAWRSNGPAVGRFAGPVADLPGLRAAVDAARAAEPPDGDLRADAVAEVIETGGRRARVAARLPVEGPWGALVEACRRVLDEVTTSPVVAIAGDVGPGARLRLEHRGDGTLTLELASLDVTFRLWRDGAQAGEARVRGAGEALDRLDAGAGWSLEVAAEDMDLSGGGILAAEASFVVEDEGVLVPVRVSVTATL